LNIFGGKAPDWTKIGRIGLHAFKSKCLKKFVICETESPRYLDQTFLPMVPPSKNLTLGSYDGTCAMIRFQMKNKKATDLELVEISCADSIASYLCEAAVP
jgi:hypothetical protein